MATTHDTHTETPTQPAKPILRGWLHLGMAPVVLIVGLVFTIFSPTLIGRIGCGVYTLAAVQLKCLQHCERPTTAAESGPEKPETRSSAGSTTRTSSPSSCGHLHAAHADTEGNARWALLILIWSIAVIGVIFRTTWLSAPRWLYTLLYVGMGWAAVGWLGQFWANGGPAVVVLIMAGGLVYTLGAVAYGTKRPRLSPKWFGFHEVFHACTIIAAILHAVAIGLAVFNVA